jgi:prephenate dehydrogenase
MSSAANSFQRIAILGTGLIGGSFALAVRKHFPSAHIVGYDREPILAEALKRGAIQEAVIDLAAAVVDADLIYIALPISTTIETIPEIAQLAPSRALVTDACSTKRKICRAAAEHFKSGALFLGGHPMAGKETEGVASADGNLFSGAKYVLVSDTAISGANDANYTPEEFASDPRVAEFLSLLKKIGARPTWLDAETHDWAVAIVSHLPQIAAIALANVIAAEEDDDSGLPLTLAGSGARDSLRLAGSPYGMWRDIALTNLDNIARSLDRLAQTIEHLRNNLNSRELERAFTVANGLHKNNFSI